MNEISVQRNLVGFAPQRWLVFCGYCKPGFARFIQPIGWATDWQVAQEWAVQHARRHEAARCPTCLHVAPLEPVTT